MTDSQTLEAAPSAFDYLRLPKFNTSDARTPLAAVLHAMPAFLYLALNVWIVGLGLIWVTNLALPLPMAVNATLLAIVAVPCAVACWILFVRCVETEAAITD